MLLNNGFKGSIQIDAPMFSKLLEMFQALPTWFGHAFQSKGVGVHSSDLAAERQVFCNIINHKLLKMHQR